MSTNIQQLSSGADLALAAYAVLKPSMSFDEYVLALKQEDKGMTQIQAEHFAAEWSVVDQYTDSGSGFSATVFEKDSQRYLAIRGTEPSDVLDLIADIDLAVGGAAAKQIVALYNYVQRLTGVNGQAVPQLEWNGQNYVLNNASGAVGLLDTPLSGALTVAGHSLGGHLAIAFGRLFPQLTGQIGTYNAPGFIDGVAAGFFARIDSALGGSGSSFQDAKTTNVYGSGLNVIARYADDHGTSKEIFLEENSHSIVKLSDSLAVYNLLQKLDPALAVSAMDSMLKASTATATDSLEQTLDIIRKIILGPGIAPTKAMGSADSQTTRDAFYVNLYGLQDENAFKALAGQVRLESLAGSGASVMSSLAKSSPDALAYRYALKELNPFALIGADYSQHNPAGELDLYDPATGKGELSETWLADRAGLLVALNQARTADLVATGGVFHVDPMGNANVRYTDVDAGLSVKVGQTTLDPLRIVFGGEGELPCAAGEKQIVNLSGNPIVISANQEFWRMAA